MCKKPIRGVLHVQLPPQRLKVKPPSGGFIFLRLPETGKRSRAPSGARLRFLWRAPSSCPAPAAPPPHRMAGSSLQKEETVNGSVHSGTGGQPQRGKIHGVQHPDGHAPAHRQLARENGGGSGGRLHVAGRGLPAHRPAWDLLPAGRLAGGADRPGLHLRRRCRCHRAGGGRHLPPAKSASGGAAALPHAAAGGVRESDGRGPPQGRRRGRGRPVPRAGRTGGDGDGTERTGDGRSAHGGAGHGAAGAVGGHVAAIGRRRQRRRGLPGIGHR